MTTFVGSLRCDYCSHSAKYTHTTRYLGQQRDSCESHIHMLVRLLGSNGGQITTSLGQQIQAADLIWPVR